jgi:ABC-type Fe3+/spermidine/putrescine transport system ATPase subunit
MTFSTWFHPSRSSSAVVVPSLASGKSLRSPSTTHDAHRAAVDRASLDVAAGDSIIVLGPSGCGKTTLLRLIAGLERPDEGEIWLDGRQVAGPARGSVPPQERRLGFVFQDLALWPHLTAQQNLDFVMGSARVPKIERAQTKS